VKLQKQTGKEKNVISASAAQYIPCLPSPSVSGEVSHNH